MNEQEILTQLRKAAEEIEIPEALKPEHIEKRLQEQKTKQQQEQQKSSRNHSRKIRNSRNSSRKISSRNSIWN